MSSEYFVEEAKREQVDSVIRINEICLPEHYSRYFYDDLLTRFPKTFLVARRGTEIVGYVMCRIELGLSETEKLRFRRKGHIVSIAVLPEHRRRGVGTLLTSEAIKGMVSYGAEECFLETRVSNAPAISFYQKLGFRITSMRRGYYLDGEDGYLMAMRIRARSTSASHQFR